MKGGINTTIQNVLFKSPFDNKTRTFLEKYHSLFTEIKQTKQPEGQYWEHYTDRTFKLTKKFNDDLGLKTIQSKLEQERHNPRYNNKKVNSLLTERHIYDITRQNKHKQLSHKKELLSALNTNNSVSLSSSISSNHKRNGYSLFNDNRKGFDKDKYSSDFLNKVKKKFPDFVKDGYLQNTFCIESGDNMRIAKMKNDINIKLYS